MSSEALHVIGGGLVGSLTAIALAQLGVQVEVHERRGDIRTGPVAAGRSINLAVTARGLKALEEVGLKQQVLALGIPMRGRMLHALDGTTSLVPYGQREEEVIWSVSRGELNRLLLTEAGRSANVTLKFHARCAGWDARKKSLHMESESETCSERTIEGAPVIACDGAWSQVRRSMLEQVQNFEYSQSFLAHGYKELSIPAAPGGEFLMEKNALHIWPRKSFMLIALPNLDGSFTCTLFLAYEGAESFASLTTPAEVQAFFTRHFPDAARRMPQLAQEFFSNPTGSMVTVKCRPWSSGNSVLLGDAAHAIVPFFGQGMNCGFEDVSALRALLSGRTGQAQWSQIFAELERQRKPNSDAIADMAVENFVEMRDTVADPAFQLKKQIGFELERRYPGTFVPRYSMVVFHPEISYAEAQRRSRAQDGILQELAAGVSEVEQVDWQRADLLVRALS